MPLAKVCLARRVERCDVLVDDLQADGGVGAVSPIDREIGDPAVLSHEVVDDLGIGIGTGDQRLEAAERFCPDSASI